MALLPSLPEVAVVTAFIASILLNVLGGANIGPISFQNPTYVTPDGITFAVWGLIYTLELVLVVYQCCAGPYIEALLETRTPCRVGPPVRWWIVGAFLLNGAWILAFVYGANNFLLPLILISLYLAALVVVYTVLNRETIPCPSKWSIFGSGISTNASWLVVATAASAFIYGRSLGWKDEYGVGGSVPAALVVVLLVTVLGSYQAVARGDFAWSLVAAWALLGIYRQQTVPNPEQFPVDARNPTLAMGALAGAVLLLLASLAGLWRKPLRGEPAGDHAPLAEAKLAPPEQP